MVVLDTAANLTTTWLLSTVLNNSVVRLLRASVTSTCLVNPRSTYPREGSRGRRRDATTGKKKENIKTRGRRETPATTELRPKRFLTIGIYGVHADYLAQRGSGTAAGVRRAWGRASGGGVLCISGRVRRMMREFMRGLIFLMSKLVEAVVGCYFEIIKAI